MLKFSACALVVVFCPRSAVVSQVVNGVATAANEHPSLIDRVLVSWRGVHGVCAGDVHPADLEVLWEGGESGDERAAANNGSLNECDWERFHSLTSELRPGFIVCVGGQEAVRAARRMAELPWAQGRVPRIAVVPVSIANDVMGTDHTLGYGTVARNLAHFVAGEDLDNRSFYHGVKIAVARGWSSGWLAASAALAGHLNRGGDEKIFDDGPNLIYLPEANFSEDRFCADVQRTCETHGYVTVIVAEGVARQIPELASTLEETLSPMALGNYLAALVALRVRLCTGDLGGRVRSGTLLHVQGWFSNDPSPFDRAQAFWVGAQGIRYLVEGATNFLLGLNRRTEEIARCETGVVSLDDVPDEVRRLPEAFLNDAGNGVSAAFVRYVAPLAGISVRRARVDGSEPLVARLSGMDAVSGGAGTIRP